MNCDVMIAKALSKYENKEIAMFSKGRHFFSRNFRRKMDELLYPNPMPRSAVKTRVAPKRLVRIIVAVLIALFAIGCTAHIFDFWGIFSVKDEGVLADISIAGVEGAPTALLERYELTYDLTGYTAVEMCTDPDRYNVLYSNEDYLISFEQATKAVADNMHFPLDNISEMPTEIMIGEYKGIIYGRTNGAYTVIFDVGDYIISLSCKSLSDKKFGKDDLIAMAETVQIVE